MMTTAPYIGKSDNNWDVGEALLEDYPESATNRLYYSLFQIVYWWAVKNRKYTETPGIVAQNKHMRMYEILLSEFKGSELYANKFKKLKNMREQADYEPEGINKDRLSAGLENWRSMRAEFIKLCSCD